MTLPACPSTPNCVSSDADDPRRIVAPLAFGERTAEAWSLLLELLTDLPRVELVERTDTTAHAVFTTRLLRFRDDLHLELRDGRGEIAVRSASRVGHWDLGTNRRRVEGLRRQLSSLLEG